MKKFFVAIIVACWFLPVQAFALDLGTTMAGGIAQKSGYSANTTETTFSETLGVVVKTALSLVGVIFMSLMVYAGYLWMSARGDESQIDKSQEIIRSAVIGLIITVGAYSITSFVLPRILSKTTGASGGGQTVGGTSGTCTWTDPRTGASGSAPSTDVTSCNSNCPPSPHWGCVWVQTQPGPNGEAWGTCTWTSSGGASGSSSNMTQNTCNNQCQTSPFVDCHFTAS